MLYELQSFACPKCGMELQRSADAAGRTHPVEKGGRTVKGPTRNWLLLGTLIWIIGAPGYLLHLSHRLIF
jgi:hypothetical protein